MNSEIFAPYTNDNDFKVFMKKFFIDGVVVQINELDPDTNTDNYKAVQFIKILNLLLNNNSMTMPFQSNISVMAKFASFCHNCINLCESISSYVPIENILELYSKAIPNYYKYLISGLGTRTNNGKMFYGDKRIKNEDVIMIYMKVLVNAFDERHIFEDLGNYVDDTILFEFLEGLKPYFGFSTNGLKELYDFTCENS
jgi:hypothetical protein